MRYYLPHDVSSFAIQRDLALVICVAKSLVTFNLKTGQKHLTLHSDKEVTTVACRGNVVVGGLENGVICVWYVRDGRCLGEGQAHEKAVSCFAGDDTGRLYSSSLDGSLACWDTSHLDPKAGKRERGGE
jgi:WD40 repeat protein